MDEEAVVDASVAFKLIVRERYTDDAQALFVAFAARGVTRIAPHLFPFEITNGLHKRVAGGMMTLEAAVQAFQALAPYEIELREINGLHEQALELAQRMDRGASYDSHYLALALARDCEFWTADDSFYRAARRLSGKVHWLSDFDPDV